MKNFITMLTLLVMVSCNSTTQRDEQDVSKTTADTGQHTSTTESNTATEHKLVLKTDQVPGDIDTVVTAELSEPLRAIAAFYAAMGGTLCDGENCQLTTALGLGKQGSDAHQSLIKKYFPDDKVAAAVIEQNCYLRPSGASTFTDFEYLNLTETGDTVIVDYNLMLYNRGKDDWISGPDIYVYKDNHFEKIQRHLWQHAE